MLDPRSLAANNIEYISTGSISELPSDPFDGQVVWVKTVRDFYVFELGSALTPDPTLVIDATGGQWIRQLHADASWSFQATWAINAITGNDENTGVDNTVPLKTWSELENRISRYYGAPPLMQQTTVKLYSSLPEYCYLNFHMSESVAANARLVIQADDSAITTDFVGAGGFSATAAITRGAGGGSRLTLTDVNTVGCDFTTKVKKRIKLTSGANIGAVGSIIKSTVATVALCSNFLAAIDPATFDGLTVTNVTPAINDEYVVQTLPSVYGFNIAGSKSSGAGSADRLSYVVYNIQCGPGSSGTTASSVNIFTGNSNDLGDDVGAISVLYAIVQCDFYSSNAYAPQGNLTNCLYTADPASSCAAVCVRLMAGCALPATAFSFNGRFATQSPFIQNDFTCQGGTTGLNILGPATFAGPCGIFDSTGDGLSLSGTTLPAIVRAANVVYGNGNGGVGINISGGNKFFYTTAPTVTGTGGDAKVGGAAITYAGNSATNAPIPYADEFLDAHLMLNTSTVPNGACIQRTGINAAVAATNVFSANPASGTYRASGVIVITTAGAAGDTVSLTLSCQDAGANPENLKVPLTDQAGVTAIAASAVGAANNKALYFNVCFKRSGGNCTYAIAFPVKTGNPVITLDMKVERID